MRDPSPPSESLEAIEPWLTQFTWEVSHLFQSGHFGQEDLRLPVELAARGARACGAPPERMIIAIKESLRRQLGGDLRDALNRAVVQWALDAYYGPRDLPPARSRE